MTPAQITPGIRVFLASLRAFRDGIAATYPPGEERERITNAAAVVIAATEAQLAGLERLNPHAELPRQPLPATPTN